MARSILLAFCLALGCGRTEPSSESPPDLSPHDGSSAPHDAGGCVERPPHDAGSADAGDDAGPIVNPDPRCDPPVQLGSVLCPHWDRAACACCRFAVDQDPLPLPYCP